jgi:hypothetical protein
MKRLLASALLGAVVVTLALTPDAHAWYPPDDSGLVGGDGGAGSADPAAGGPVCGTGFHVVCEILNVKYCVRYKYTSYSFAGGVTNSTNYGQTCEEWAITESRKFYP